MPLAGQVHSCLKCNKRLNVDNVAGTVTVLCPGCKQPNVVTVVGPAEVRR